MTTTTYTCDFCTRDITGIYSHDLTLLVRPRTETLNYDMCDSCKTKLLELVETKEWKQ